MHNTLSTNNKKLSDKPINPNDEKNTIDKIEEAQKVLLDARNKKMELIQKELNELMEKHKFSLYPQVSIGPGQQQISIAIVLN